MVNTAFDFIRNLMNNYLNWSAMNPVDPAIAIFFRLITFC
jgi:hypothetical protein